MAKSGKTRKAVAKRFKKTATGKLKYNSPGRRHLASSKTTKQKRQLRKQKYATPGDHARLMPSIATYK